MATTDCIVVGGGVIGAACAYYLRRTGRSVALIDRGSFGRGCSHGNCGYVCPSHVLPLAGPGALWSTLKTLLRRNSPLKVRWRFDPALWRWFRQFARRCNQADMLRAGHAIQSLLDSSRSLYDDLLTATLRDVDWEPSGLLFVFRSPSTMDHYADVDQLLQNEFGLGAARYDGQALVDFEPALKSGLAGGWYYRHDARLNPAKLMAAWQRVLVDEGVELHEQCELVDLTADGRRARRLVTNHGELAAEQIVVATGAWTPQLHRLLKQPIAIQPGKGYSLTMPRPTVSPRYPMILEEHRVAITPFSDAYRIGSTMEFAGYDDRLRPARLNLLRDGASHYLREPTAEPVVESWCGWRPMTPDGLPFIGRVPAFDNVYLAAGHGMLGVSMSPATGRLVAELVSGQSPHVDPQPFAVGRTL
jgi:D-amino-acid dehydrogenase